MNSPTPLQDVHQRAVTFGDRVPRDLPPVETQRRTDICLKAERVMERVNRSFEHNRDAFISAEEARPYTVQTIRKLEALEPAPHWSMKPVRNPGQPKSRVDAGKLVSMHQKSRQFRIVATRDQMIDQGKPVGCGPVVRNLLKNRAP